MSRTTAGIMRINQELDKISGLDGIVADKIEELEKVVKTMVFNILDNHSEASLFNYYGNSKSDIENMLDKIDEEPLLDDVLDSGNVLVSRAYSDEELGCFVRYQIINYKGSLYYIEHEEKECTAFRKLQ